MAGLRTLRLIRDTFPDRPVLDTATLALAEQLEPRHRSPAFEPAAVPGR